MNKRKAIAIGFAAALGLNACDRAEEQQVAPETAPPAGEKTAVQEFMQKGKELKELASEAALETMQAANEKGGEIAMVAAEMAETAADSASEVAQQAIAQAEDWIDQAEVDLAQGREDLAASFVVKLEEIKPSLPQSLQARVDLLQGKLGGSEETPAPGEAAVETSTGAVPPSVPAQ